MNRPIYHRVASRSAICFTLGFLIITNARGQLTWRTLDNAPVAGFRHEDIFFINENTGWITQYPGKIHRTTDGGETWELQFDESQTVIRCLGFADSLRGWAGSIGPDCFEPPGGSKPTILWETSDGGETWTPVETIPDPAPEGLCGISVVSDSVIYATGRICGTPRLIKSTDRGTTWETIDLSPMIDRLVDTYFITPDAGFVVGGIGEIDADAQGRVLYTWDGGATWDIRHTTASIGHWCWKISFPTLNTGYISLETFHTGITSYFLKTTNGGVTWEENLLVGGYREQGIGFATTEVGWAGGGVLTYGTTDGGLTWSQDNFGSNINRFRMLSDSLGFAVGKRVYKYSYEPPTAVGEPGVVLPEQYNLNQNYPNPFNPSTTISFEIPEAVPVLLQVYNIMGHRIATLIDGQKEAGTHTVNFDASNLAAGVYYYRLEAGTFIDSRRMIYLK